MLKLEIMKTFFFFNVHFERGFKELKIIIIIIM